MTNFHEIAAILEDTCSVQIGDREEIGSGSAKGVEEEEDTGRVLVEFEVIFGWLSPVGTMVRLIDIMSSALG